MKKWNYFKKIGLLKIKVEKKIRIDLNIWNKFRMICHIQGTTMTNTLNILIREFVKDNNDAIERFLMRAYLRERKDNQKGS